MSETKLEVKLISAAEVRQLLNPKVLLERLEQALGNFSLRTEGGVVQPVRTVLPVNRHHGFLGVMPAYTETEEALAAKLVTFYPENKDCPTHQAWVLYFDPKSGSLRAILDGESITDIRTGIASAVATKHLANPASKILAVLGAGIQARSHIKAMSLLHSFEEVRVWSRTLSSAQKLVQEVRDQYGGVSFKACSTAEEAVTGADIIVTATFATTPILQAGWIKPGAHINAVGACRPDWHELDSELMKSAIVYCDSREACEKEAGDVILSQCDIYAEIGEVIMGQKEAQWKQTTVFKSVGMAIEDVISAQLVYDKYMERLQTAAP